MNRLIAATATALFAAAFLLTACAEDTDDTCGSDALALMAAPERGGRGSSHSARTGSRHAPKTRTHRGHGSSSHGAPAVVDVDIECDD